MGRRKEYLVYENGVFLISGTSNEVSEYMGISKGTLFANVSNMKKRRKEVPYYNGRSLEWYAQDLENK